MMKQIFLILMTILFTAGVVSAQEKAMIAADQTTFDFGSIQEDGGSVTHTFQIKNSGGAPLVMTRVVASCGCATPEWTQEPIAPGKTGTLKITFNPENRPGPFVKTVSVYSNGKTGSFIFTIRGIVEQK